MVNKIDPCDPSVDKACPSVLTEIKSESNRTECYLGQDSNSLLVYKVEPSSAAHTEDTVRTIAIERQGATEIEVQVWKTVEGNVHTVPPLLKFLSASL